MSGFSASHCSFGYIFRLAFVSAFFPNPGIIVKLASPCSSIMPCDEAEPVGAQIDSRKLSSIALEFTFLARTHCERRLGIL